MSKPSSLPDGGKLEFDDEDMEDLFASPESGATTQKHTPSSQTSSAQRLHSRSDSRSRQLEKDMRDARLRAELDRIREVNRVIESVTASLTKAKENMETVDRTVNNASALLATWTRILSQTEHNQRLILNPNWQGAAQDIEDIENEDLRRQHDAERRAAEEQRRREEVQRRAEEEERRKAAAATVPGTRGSGKVRGLRGANSSTRGHVGVGGQPGRGRGTAVGTSSSTRGGSSIGRAGSTRGRGRGLG